MTDGSDRPVFTPETLDGYFHGSAPTRHVLSDAPECFLIIEPDREQLRLRTPATDSPADLGSYDRIAFDIVEEPGEDGIWFELTIDAEATAYESYSLIVSVVDQLESGQQFSSAVAKALATFKSLLTRRTRLSDDQELGLFAELTIFEHLLGAIGEGAAIAAWLGPQAEEHDFVLPACDVEVKSTRGEKRVHLIGSENQLTSSPGRPLHLLSMQFTAGGAADRSETLPRRVGRVRRMLAQHAPAFDDHLRTLGYDPTDADEVYTRSFIPRSLPRCYPVDDRFPVITRDSIDQMVPSAHLVVGVAYRIDVTGLPPGEPPAELADFCERGSADGA